MNKKEKSIAYSLYSIKISQLTGIFLAIITAFGYFNISLFLKIIVTIFVLIATDLIRLGYNRAKLEVSENKSFLGNVLLIIIVIGLEIINSYKQYTATDKAYFRFLSIFLLIIFFTGIINSIRARKRAKY